MSATQNRIEPGAFKALLWEFFWRLGSATVLIFAVVMLMALGFGCSSEPVEGHAGAASPPAVEPLCANRLDALRTELLEATRLAEAATRSVVTLEACRNSFWQAVEEPSVPVAAWDRDARLEDLVRLVQARDRCEDRVIYHLAGDTVL